MKKLRGSRGVTLTETLCTVLIVLLISAMLAVGVRFAVRTYRESMELSETELLCSTLTAAISDKLRYSGDVNGTGLTDVNDAQLTYDMYNTKYDSFDVVSMLKFLNADVNGDKTVNSKDATAIVNAIK